MKTKSIVVVILLSTMLACSGNKESFTPGIHYFTDFGSQHVASRNIEVWLPEGYTPGNSYDVLYMHDGQNVFNPQTSYTGVTWGVMEAMDSLIQAEKIRPAIVVAIWNTEKRFHEYMPNKPQERIQQLMESSPQPEALLSDEYLKFIVEELKPFIDSTYSTNSGPQGTFIMGSSMGGLISMYAIAEYPGVFGAAACISTHWPVGDGVFLEYVQNNIPDPETHRLYFDHGTINLDSLYEPYQVRVDHMLLEKGYEKTNNLQTVKFEGADHNEAAWKQRIHVPLEFLLSEKVQ